MEACSPSGSDNQGVGTTDPAARVFEANNLTAGGSEVALGSAQRSSAKIKEWRTQVYLAKKTRECT